MCISQHRNSAATWLKNASSILEKVDLKLSMNCFLCLTLNSCCRIHSPIMSFSVLCQWPRFGERDPLVYFSALIVLFKIAEQSLFVLFSFVWSRVLFMLRSLKPLDDILIYAPALIARGSSRVTSRRSDVYLSVARNVVVLLKLLLCSPLIRSLNLSWAVRCKIAAIRRCCGCPITEKFCNSGLLWMDLHELKRL